MQLQKHILPFLHKKAFQKLFLSFFVAFMVFVPALFPFAQSENGTVIIQYASAAGQTVTPDNGNLDCGVGPSGDIIDCIPYIFYWIVYWPASLFLQLTGQLFDAVVAFSLDSNLIGGASLVQNGWAMTRDIVNGLFILVILYIAISMILQIGAANAKRMLIALIVVGLLVNFSLFFSRLVIDASNVAAYTFYSHIGVEKSSDPNSNIISSGSVPERNLSANIVKGLEPQKFLGTDTFAALGSVAGGSKITAFIFVFLIAAAINLVAAIAFIAGSVIFLSRVVALWLLMIVAPIAFLGFVLPKLSGGMGQKWLKMLLSQSFVAPIFLFFFYLLVQFVGSGDVESLIATTNNITLIPLLATLILIGAFYILLFLAVIGISASLGGKAGSAGVNLGKAVGGKALGKYSGAWASGGRRFVGGTAENLRQSDRVQAWTKREGVAGVFGRGLERGLNRTAKSSFDVRATAIGAGMAKQSGLDVGKAKEGGSNADLERRMKRNDEQRDRLKSQKLRDEYDQARVNKGLRYKGSSAEARKMAENPEFLEKQYKQAASDVAKAEVLSKANPHRAQELYNKQSAEDRAKLQNAASGMGNSYSKLFSEFKTSFEHASGIAVAGGLSKEAQAKEQEAKRKETAKGEVQHERREEERRNETLIQSIQDLAPSGQATDQKKIEEHVRNLGRKITSLDDGVLRNEKVMESLDGTQLQALAKSDKMSDQTISAIRDHFSKNPKAFTESAQNYFSYSPARARYNFAENGTPKPESPKIDTSGNVAAAKADTGRG